MRDRERERSDPDPERTGEHEETPRSADQQAAPEPERPVRPDEEAEESVDQLEDPPQAEGDRDAG